MVPSKLGGGEIVVLARFRVEGSAMLRGGSRG
jgi:hypothetical protein